MQLDLLAHLIEIYFANFTNSLFVLLNHIRGHPSKCNKTHQENGNEANPEKSYYALLLTDTVMW